MDSVQVYRGMDIGTAKPSLDDRRRIPHHMIDVADPAAPFSVAEFQVLGVGAVEEIAGRGSPVLIVGGSGLHFRSLVDPFDFPPTDPTVRQEVEAVPAAAAVAELVGADPSAADLVDLANPRRVIRAVEILRITGLTPSDRLRGPRPEAVRAYRPVRPVAAVGIDPGGRLAERVQHRFDRMLADGLLDEVRGLALGPTAATAVGYREMNEVIAGVWDLAQARRRAVDASTALARRQRTYHRRDPRIDWIEWDDDPDVMARLAVARLEEAGWTS